ncbi:MAG: FkbM family methyltransferase [Proteobacteria bacterium]|nr:FkbM family methyltransferase [Pseudomonadota bacterium]
MLRTFAKKLVALTPYRITRSSPNRFDAVEHSLGHLRRLGYAPRLVIDAGAHAGWFSLAARRTFPDAHIHMIEPQPACRAALEALSREPGFTFHPVALSASSGTVAMVFAPERDTGGHVVWDGEQPAAETEIEARTLDHLLVDGMTADDRALLKLDLQGHEMMALQGASATLPLVEVVLIEVSFFTQIGAPIIADMVAFFEARGFALFDIAALAGRTRDDRLRQGDFVFVRRDSPLQADRGWE